MKPRQIALLSIILAFALLAAPLPSDGQQPAKVYRIAYLGVSTGGYDTDPHNCPIQGAPHWQALVEGLREDGYIKGENLVIECRWTKGREEDAPTLATELVSLKPDLIVAMGTVLVLAAKQATRTIPIVMVDVGDPVGRGLVASLVHPGGNVTGLTFTFMEMEGKRLQLLKEAVPKASRVAVLSYLTGAPRSGFRREEETAARALGVTLQFYEVRALEELEAAFVAMKKERAEALLVVPDPFFYLHAQRIVDLAAKSRLPAMYPFRESAKAGGLMAYDLNRPEVFRRIGFYVDKILKGTNPGDLPVEQPTKFELVINLKTANALGLKIPESLLRRADEVVQ